MSATNDDIVYAAITLACASTAVAVQNMHKKRKKRRFWVRQLLLRRDQLGAYDLLMAELRATDTALYIGFTRISPEDFDFLLATIKPLISGSSRFRKPVQPDIKLAVTLC